MERKGKGQGRRREGLKEGRGISKYNNHLPPSEGFKEPLVFIIDFLLAT
jgi:hypothetical protein